MRNFVQAALIVALAGWGCGSVSAAPTTQPADAEKVRQVLAGELEEANAAWFGFDPVDATESLQAAIRSGAKRVIVPNMGTDWIVRPIKLVGHQEIVFQDGVVVTAKRGEFKGKNDCLFSAANTSGITLRGQGRVTLQMHKADYAAADGGYAKAEWRMVLAFYSCDNLTIEGLTLARSGGDGIYLGTDRAGKPYCENVHIRNVICDDNYRQGISIISAHNLLIEDSIFKNTSGTAPAAGIDFEPNSPSDRISNIIVRRCLSTNNAGAGIMGYFRKLDGSQPVSVLVEDCQVTGTDLGLVVGAVRDDGPQGWMEFKNCTVENTARSGGYIYDKSADRMKVRFTNCTWKNVATGASAGANASPEAAAAPSKDLPPPTAPLLIYLRRPEITQRMGGVEFVDCRVFDNGRNRPVLKAAERISQLGVSAVRGNITVYDATGAGATYDLGTNSRDVDLKITSASSAAQ